MSNYNQVILVGRLTRDPELRQTNNGTDVANFGLAVNRGFKEDSPVDFFDVTIWRELAVNVSAHKHKGDLVLVSGSLQNDSYEKDGQTRTKTIINGRDVRYLSSKGQGNAESSSNTNDEDIPF